MLQLLWGIINIGLFLFFAYVSIRAVKLVYEKIGLLAAVVFVVGLMSVSQSEGGSTRYKKDNEGFISEDSIKTGTRTMINVCIDKNLLSSRDLFIHYGKSKQGNLNTPINASSAVNGFVSGISWEPQSVSVSRTSNDGEFSYNVLGTVVWKLMGIKLYSQAKQYEGIALVK